MGLVLAEQAEYYRQRAGEYEDWWFRRGRYDHGREANERWFAEAREVRAALTPQIPAGEVLELACGTGLWTELLAEHAGSVTAMDASPEVISIARDKVPAENVEWVEQDLFEWEPRGVHDMCLFAFWLSHVPAERMTEFLARVARSLAPGGVMYVIDSARSESASARDHELQPREEQIMTRRLADGREYQIVKHWFDAASLQAMLEQAGWRAEIGSTAEYFVYGSAQPAGWKREI